MDGTRMMCPGDVVFKDPWGTGFVMESDDKDFVKVNFPAMGQTLVLSHYDSVIDYISKKRPLCEGNSVFSLMYGYGFINKRSLHKDVVEVMFLSQAENARFVYNLDGLLLSDDGLLKYADDINKRNVTRIYSVFFCSPFIPPENTTNDLEEINRRLAKIEEKLTAVSQKADSAYGLALI